jgi:glycosyltransferase involved in cell wall biosynthesis
MFFGTDKPTDPLIWDTKLRIAIAVHGRFHAFDEARALIELGHHVVLFTNVPAFFARAFGIRPENMHVDWLHGVTTRVLNKIGLGERFEAFLHRLFGTRVQRALTRWSKRHGDFDIVHIFSGIAEETLRDRRIKGLKSLLRGSAHIVTQSDLLADEQRRIACAITLPSAWMQSRECREYALAEKIVVMSSFAKRSFIARGLPAERMLICPGAAETGDFFADARTRECRRERVRNGAKLTVLLVGTISAQKGVVDLVQVAEALAPRMRFRFVGSIAADAGPLMARVRAVVEVHPRVPQQQLASWYADADIMFHPTIQDGFAVVLAQALMSGVPVLCSENCAASDIITEGKTGFVVAARDAAAMVERLTRLDTDRALLLTMFEALAATSYDFSWTAAARVFVREHLAAMAC